MSSSNTGGLCILIGLVVINDMKRFINVILLTKPRTRSTGTLCGLARCEEGSEMKVESRESHQMASLPAHRSNIFPIAFLSFSIFLPNLV